MIYFDNAATTMKKPPQVSEAVLNALGNMGNSGRGAHGATLGASRIIYDTRVLLGELFGISAPERIAFTSNATEALNTAISGMFKKEITSLQQSANIILFSALFTEKKKKV